MERTPPPCNRGWILAELAGAFFADWIADDLAHQNHEGWAAFSRSFADTFRDDAQHAMQRCFPAPAVAEPRISFGMVATARIS